MTSPAFAAPVSLVREWASLVRDAWSRLTPRYVLGALLLGAGAWLWEVIVVGPVLYFYVHALFSEEARRFLFGPLREYYEPYLPLLLRWEFVAIVLLLSVAIADRAVDTHRAGRMAYVAAVVVAVAFATTLTYVVAPVPESHRGVEGTATGPGRLVPTIYDSMVWLMFGGLATFVYVDRKRARATRERLAAAELERARKTKRTLESRLAAMQARVEPQFLFNTLAQVRDLYDVNEAHGEQMLDELIAYLRAAMPKMRDTSSTVGQEIELVRAYLAIVRLRLRGRLAFDIELPDALADARMPPMMLLPLVDHAIAHGLAKSQANGGIRIKSVIAGDKVRLEIADSGVGFLPETEGEGIAGIRERLAALYEGDASLVLQTRSGGATEAVMEIPFEAAAHVPAPALHASTSGAIT